MKIVIKPRRNSIFEAGGSLINGGLFIAVAIYFFDRNMQLSLLLICGAVRFSIYSMIDFWVYKTIYFFENKVFIKCFGISFKLDTKRSFLIIEDMMILNPINAKYPTLNIYRNPSGVWSRLFKNKIKLYAVTRDNISVSKMDAQRISEMFGIEFKDVYDFN